MKTFLSTLFGVLFLVTTFVHADNGPIYAAAFSKDPQLITTSGGGDPDFMLINFEQDVAPPVGIGHVINGDPGLFVIETDGSYQIYWWMVVQATEAGDTSVQIRLRNASTDTPIPSSLVEQSLIGTEQLFVSGSVSSVQLSADTVLDLEVAAISQATDVVVTQPFISISTVPPESVGLPTQPTSQPVSSLPSILRARR